MVTSKLIKEHYEHNRPAPWHIRVFTGILHNRANLQFDTKMPHLLQIQSHSSLNYRNNINEITRRMLVIEAVSRAWKYYYCNGPRSAKHICLRAFNSKDLLADL